MKRVFIACFLIVVLASYPITANPIELYQAQISELMFDSDDHWILEINFDVFGGFKLQDYDSICIQSLFGTSKLRLEFLTEGGSYFVITSDSLTSPLQIERREDSIVVCSYPKDWPGHSWDDVLLFGSDARSECDSLQIGYSIARSPQSDIFCKDKSPTMGLPNDTTGTKATLQGSMFNMSGQRIIRGWYGFLTPLLDDSLTFLPDSSYSIRIYSRKTCVNTLQSRGHDVSIEDFCFDVEPDSVVRRDIHLKEADPWRISTGREKPDYNLSITNYPNPFNSSTNFSIVVPPSLRSRKGAIQIYNVAGQAIKTIDVSSRTTVQWDGTDAGGLSQPTGVYYYQLVFDNRVYRKGSMILLK